MLVETRTRDPKPGVVHKVGPSSQRDTLLRLDGRGAIARPMKRIRDELIGAMNGELTPQRSMVIDMAAFRAIRAEMLMAQSFRGGLLAEEAARVRRLSELAEDRIRRAKALEDAVVTLAQLLAEDDRLRSDMAAVRPNDDGLHRRCSVNVYPFLQIHLGRWFGLPEGNANPHARLPLEELYTVRLGNFVLTEAGLAKLGAAA
jgi:hypothetical protein